MALTGVDAPMDYWADLASGTPWMATPVQVGSSLQSYDLPLDGFAAQGQGTPRPMVEMGTMVWFAIADASGLELELSNIRLE